MTRRTILLVAAVLPLVCLPVAAQPFRADPYGISLTGPGGRAHHPFAGGLYNPVHQFVDLDADTDLDLVLHDPNDGSVQFFRNLGTRQSPDFRLEPDGLALPELRGWFRFSDVTGDGFPDLLTGGDSLNTAAVYAHTGQPGTATFVLLEPVLRDTTGVAVYVQQQCIPAVADIDGDGDQDLFSLNPSIGTINFYENTGGSTNFRLAFRTDFYQGIQICPGCGPPGDDVVHGQGTMTFADVDGDGDQDMFYGDLFDDGVFFYRNVGTPFAAVLDSVSGRFPPADPVITAGFNQPTLDDLDADGDPDLFVSVLPPFQARDNFYHYENTGTPTAFAFSLRTRNFLSMLDAGLQAAPAAADLDGDGDADLLVGDLNGNVALIRNAGGPAAPAYVWEDSALISSATRFALAPALADLDADGDPDLVIGHFAGGLEFRRNTGTPANPHFTVEASWFDSISAGLYAAPAFADIDGDGDMDFFLGRGDGRVAFYRNIGTPGSARFELSTSALAGIHMTGNAKPSFGDLNGDTAPDLVVGGADGGLLFLRNDGPPADPVFTPVDGVFPSVESFRESSPVLVDIDADGDADMFLGHLRGGISFFRREGSSDVTASAGGRAVPRTIVMDAAPNPFNGGTMVRFSLPVAAHATLRVYAADGRLVATLHDGELRAGDHRAAFNGGGLASGVYFLRLTAGGLVSTGRVVLLR